MCHASHVSWPWLLGWLGRCVGLTSSYWIASDGLAHLQNACKRLLIAAFCGGVIGVERKATTGPQGAILDRPAGLRTMTLVSFGSAAYILACTFSPDPALHNPTRLAAQVCTGVGFIGAGVIAKGGRNDPARGVTTACAVWVSASLGVLAASGLTLLALWATGLAVSVLRVSRFYQERPGAAPQQHVDQQEASPST